MKIRWHWGTGISAVYAVFAIATSGMVAFSMREPVDLVSDDYYEQAVELDQRREAEARAASLGGTFTIVPDLDEGRVLVAWPASVVIESGTITLYRPSDASKDRVMTIAPGAGRHEIVPVGALAAGRWVLQVAWRSGGQPFYAERALTIGGKR